MDPTDEILSALDEIVCDYQCGHGYLPDGAWGWVCGCGNQDAKERIRAAITRATSDDFTT
jgi:hypothetical protein